MRWLWLIVSLLLAGCVQTDSGGTKTSGQQPDLAPRSAVAPVQTNQSSVIVTPSLAVKGKVAMVNPGARHAILSFPLGQMPPLGQRLNVYRSGLKVGEVKITGPKRDVNIAADIVAGECQVGDEVRED
jgi:hypothetical protein